MDWLFTLAGLLILLFAGDALVKGAVNLSLRLGIPALIVSLTVVAFGTSAPELLISIQAIWDGVPGLALGNVVGSNTANVLLVLGLPAIIATMHTSEHNTRGSFSQMLLGTLLFIGLCAFGVLTWISGLILLTALAAMLLYQVRKARKHLRETKENDEIEGADANISGRKIAFYMLIGLIGLPLGANLLVTGSTNIAREFGMSETVIGLTLVAIGTSLPELATTVMATLRRQADVALGNVIGSNMFNLLGIMGVASLVGPIPIAASVMSFDIWIMLGASLMLIPFVFFKVNVTRVWGIGLVALYVGYIAMVLV